MELTRTEFTLLEMFLAHPRQVLTREQILKAVWGFDFEPSSNSLDVYVMYLRRKTEAGGEPRLVHTVRGVGYVLRPGRRGVSGSYAGSASLPLRSRLALLVAAAVAFAVAAVVGGVLVHRAAEAVRPARRVDCSSGAGRSGADVASILDDVLQTPPTATTAHRARDAHGSVHRAGRAAGRRPLLADLRGEQIADR